MKRLVIVFLFFFVSCVQTKTGVIDPVSNNDGFSGKNIYRSSRVVGEILKIDDAFEYFGVETVRSRKGTYSVVRDFHVFGKAQGNEITKLVVIVEGKVRQGYFLPDIFNKKFYTDKHIGTINGKLYQFAKGTSSLSRVWTKPIIQNNKIPPNYVTFTCAGKHAGVKDESLFVVYYAENIRFLCDGEFRHISDWKNKNLLVDKQKAALKEIEKRAEKAVQFLK